VDRLAGRRGRVGEGRDVGEVPPAPLAPDRNTDTPPRRWVGLGVGGLLESLGLRGNGFVTFRGDGDSISPGGGEIAADGRRAGSILGLIGDLVGLPRMIFWDARRAPGGGTVPTMSPSVCPGESAAAVRLVGVGSSPPDTSESREVVLVAIAGRTSFIDGERAPMGCGILEVPGDSEFSVN
jgi:hypothetical protein